MLMTTTLMLSSVIVVVVNAHSNHHHHYFGSAFHQSLLHKNDIENQRHFESDFSVSSMTKNHNHNHHHHHDIDLNLEASCFAVRNLNRYDEEEDEDDGTSQNSNHNHNLLQAIHDTEEWWEDDRFFSCGGGAGGYCNPKMIHFADRRRLLSSAQSDHQEPSADADADTVPAGSTTAIRSNGSRRSQTTTTRTRRSHRRPNDEVSTDALYRSTTEVATSTRDDDDSSGRTSCNRQDSDSSNIPMNMETTTMKDHLHPLVLLANRVKMWPPWPLNHVLTSSDDDDKFSNNRNAASENHNMVTAKNTYPSNAALIWEFLKQTSRVAARQIQEVGSELWFHLPPAAPPLILLSLKPRPQNIFDSETGQQITKKVIPLLRNSFARHLVLSSSGLAILSWAHMELNRKQKLTPLNLLVHDLEGNPVSTAASGSSNTFRGRRGFVSKVFLPPALPEEVPEPELNALQQQIDQHKKTTTTDTSSSSTKQQQEEESDNDDSSIAALVRPKLRMLSEQIQEKATPLQEWMRVRQLKLREGARVQRMAVFDELVALQALKRQQDRVRRRKGNSSSLQQTDKPGYALVTGASQGIGRAIAVELARWEIPLILVARDIDRLTSLAYDLEACYGVHCCVLQADLSERDSAEKIHQTTQKAGLKVDVLINNAGIAHDGLTVDTDLDVMEDMVMLNMMSTAKLCKLYGQDMKRQRRGRILMVSSMTGTVSACPNSGLYGATKAFGKSLALSMAKEMEPYGVGVTALLPGAVKDTQFRERSGSDKNLMWYLPFYAKPAQTVAHLGVVAMLDGDTQVIPGWPNRVFVKVLRPILPQRFEILAVQTAWSPLNMLSRFFAQDDDTSSGSTQSDNPSISFAPTPDLKPRYRLQQPPRLLQLPQTEPMRVDVPQPSAPATQSNATSSSDFQGSRNLQNHTDSESKLSSSSAEPVEDIMKNSEVVGNSTGIVAGEEEYSKEREKEYAFILEQVGIAPKDADPVPKNLPSEQDELYHGKKEKSMGSKPPDQEDSKTPKDKWGALSPRLEPSDDFLERHLLNSRRGIPGSIEGQEQIEAISAAMSNVRIIFT